ncbi:MAG: hypothetical protein PHZ11_07545 [Desulfitobacteriaceae bacterium]|nr:hypothetical protein [Desulfitobacteriaceae bacterium]MDD4346723.1 hypothetical protein [Desulfitobacteriaceae bacterium]MDD4402534.1 hypothetical protein [Desulfitobacteriaceae bacterium]
MTESGGNAKFSDTTGKWLGWIAIIIGVIGFLWQPIWMGAIAIICGIIGLFSPQKILNWVAIGVGAIAIIIGLI